MMLDQEGMSGADQIHLLLNHLSNKLLDLPIEQRNWIEEDLQKIRSSVTDWMRAESAQRERYEQAVWMARFPDEYPNPVARIAFDGKILYCNPVSTEPFIWSLSRGESISAIFQPCLEAAIRQGKQVQQEVQIGESVYSISLMPFPDEQYVNLYGLDITERKRVEDQLRVQASIFEILEEPVIIADLQNAIAYWNSAAERVFGWKAVEAVGKTTKDLLRPEVSDEARAAAIRGLQEGKPVVTETVVYTKDNRRLVVAGYSVALRDPQGNLIGYAAVNQDITERKRTEDALRESEASLARTNQKISEILSSITDDFYVIDHDWKFVYANKQFTGKLGKEPEDLIGNPVWEMFPKHISSILYDNFHASMEKGDVRRFEFKGKYTDAWYSVTSFPSAEGITVIGSDITERKRAEEALRKNSEALRESESRLHEFIESTHDTFFTLDYEWRVTYANRNSGKQIGVDPEKVIGMSFWALFPQLLGTNVEVNYRKVMAERTPIHFRQSGIYTKSVYDISLYPTREGLAIFAIDRTDEIRHKQQIENERARLEAVLQALPVGVWITDKDGRITEKNKQSDVIWAGNAPQVENVDQYSEYQSWDAQSGKKLETEDFPLTRVLKSGHPVEAEEHRILRLDGSEGFVLVSAKPIEDVEGQLVGAVAVNVDITNLRRLEAERVEAITKNEVQRRLMEQREHDRHAIARDLHDGPIQMLSSSLFHLYMIKEAFPEPKLQEELDEIGTDIKGTIRELRGVLNDLRPPALMHFGLSKVIKMFMEDFRGQYPAIEVHVDADVDDKCLSNDTHLTLYRIFQAGINNIIRHSEATRVWVAFEIEKERFILTLRDNGKGFEVRNDLSLLTRTGHFGLVGMKERAEAIGSELTVSSTPKRGTTIIVKGPLDGKTLK